MTAGVKNFDTSLKEHFTVQTFPLNKTKVWIWRHIDWHFVINRVGTLGSVRNETKTRQLIAFLFKRKVSVHWGVESFWDGPLPRHVKRFFPPWSGMRCCICQHWLVDHTDSIGHCYGLKQNTPMSYVQPSQCRHFFDFGEMRMRVWIIVLVVVYKSE